MKLKSHKSIKLCNVRINWIMVVGIVGIGVIMDLCVAKTDCWRITVTESYMEYVYSAIVTISVLSFTLIALISGMLNTCYYGYQLKDILGFKNAPVNLKKFISVSLMNIGIATVVLAFSFRIDCVNTLTFLLFSLLYMVLCTGLNIYEIMTNETYCVGMVKKYYETIQVKNKTNYNLFKFHLNKLSVALEIAIKGQSKEEKDRIFEMVCTLCSFMKNIDGDKAYYDYFNYLNSVIKKYVVDLSLYFGYNEMLREIFHLYEVISGNEFDRNDLLILPLKEMQFYDDRTLQNLNYLSEIMDFNLLDEYKEHKIKDEEIQRIFINYIAALLKNQLCSTKCKKNMISSYINELSNFRWHSKNHILLVQQVVLLDLLRYHILQNEDLDERKFIFEELVKSTFIKNAHNTNDTYYNYLSIVFQVFYAYIVLEKETLRQDYRENIKKLFQTDISTSNIVRLNVPMLIKMNVEGILFAIARRIEKEDTFTTRFEYFPTNIMAKSVVWTKEFNMNFMFLVYMLYNDEVGFYSLYGRFFRWGEIDNKVKLKILGEFMKFFNYETRVLKKDTSDEIGILAELMKCTFSVNNTKQNNLFDHLNEEYVKLYLKEADRKELPELDLNDIKIQINELMEQENVFGWSANYNDSFYIKYSTPYSICRKEFKNNRNVAKSIQEVCLSAINNYIRSSTSELELTFDEHGLNKMLKFLNTCKYDSKNYVFTDDWAFTKELRESIDFQEIIKKNDLIENLDTYKINSYIYFNKDNFKFNIKISQYECINLTDEECVEYIENSKVYNGLYNVDGALMAKDKAISTVQKLFCKELIAIKLMISFKRNDVTHIKFKYK